MADVDVMAPDVKPIVVWMGLLAGGAFLLKVSDFYPPASPWVALAVAVTFTAMAARAFLHARRDARELSDYDAELRQVCAGCGYDLRATPLRCPECGREPQLTDASPPPGFSFDPPGRRRR